MCLDYPKAFNRRLSLSPLQAPWGQNQHHQLLVLGVPPMGLPSWKRMELVTHCMQSHRDLFLPSVHCKTRLHNPERFVPVKDACLSPSCSRKIQNPTIICFEVKDRTLITDLHSQNLPSYTLWKQSPPETNLHARGPGSKVLFLQTTVTRDTVYVKYPAVPGTTGI